VVAMVLTLALLLLLLAAGACPDARADPRLAPAPAAADSNYSLPYTIFYNNGGNYYGANMSYPPPSPRSFGFVADNAAHTVGTNTFDFSGHPTWPNFVRNGKDYKWTPSCPAPGVKTQTALGALCCAPGGCIAQMANVSAIVALTEQVVSAQVSPALEGNCVLDFEGWNSVVFGNEFGACPSGPPQDPDDPPPASNIQRDLSLAMAKADFPRLNPAQVRNRQRCSYMSQQCGHKEPFTHIISGGCPCCSWKHRRPSITTLRQLSCW
jgi:hypothetical protein